MPQYSPGPTHYPTHSLSHLWKSAQAHVDAQHGAHPDLLHSPLTCSQCLTPRPIINYSIYGSIYQPLSSVVAPPKALLGTNESHTMILSQLPAYDTNISRGL